MEIKCGWCGTGLDRLGEDHSCERGNRAMAFLASGDKEVLRN